MKAAQVLKTLGITRQTLTKYVKEGIIKVKILPNGRYEYDDDSVYEFKNGKKDTRIVAGYISVWKGEEFPSTNGQLSAIKEYCNNCNLHLDMLYIDEECTSDADTRGSLLMLLKAVLHDEIKKIIIYDKKRLSMTEYYILMYIIRESNCEIDIVAE